MCLQFFKHYYLLCLSVFGSLSFLYLECPFPTFPPLSWAPCLSCCSRFSCHVLTLNWCKCPPYVLLIWLLWDTTCVGHYMCRHLSSYKILSCPLPEQSDTWLWSSWDKKHFLTHLYITPVRCTVPRTWQAFNLTTQPSPLTLTKFVFLLINKIRILSWVKVGSK